MSILAKNQIGTRLPYESELQWIEGTGTQWIDIEISPHSKILALELSICLAYDTSDYKGIAGAWGPNDTRFQVFKGLNNTGSIGIGTYKEVTYPFDEWCVIRVDAVSMTARIGSQEYSGFDASNGFVDESIWLFNRNTNYSPSQHDSPCKMKCSCCKIWDGSSLLCDMVPVSYVDEDGLLKCSMYDKARHRVLANSGAGDFVAGPLA